MKIIFFIILLRLCLGISFAQNATFVPQIPHTKDDAIQVFVNTKAGLMASVQEKTLKFWNLKTLLLLNTTEIPEQIDIYNNLILSEEGVFYAQRNNFRSFFVTQNNILQNDTIDFLRKSRVNVFAL